jgi:multisubunit Na+/H+ antiporter MnhC subunit
VLLGELCTISPLDTLVPVPAAKVPAEAATSTPPLPDVIVLTAIV